VLPERWSAARTALWLGAAFAAGSIPAGRLLTRALTGASLADLGDGKSGSSNVARSVGFKAGTAVFVVDTAKAYLPATAARLAGAGENTVAALTIASMLGHITVVRGRGAACALGGCFAVDPVMMAIGCAPIVGGAAVHRHPQSVAATAVALPVISFAVHRRPARALRVALMMAVLLAARLRGSPGAGWPATAAVWSNRFWLDRDG
jgi:acyl phosphate:glycerol-3-phosphate acyltransferase